MCESEVYEAPSYFHSHRCSNKARFVVTKGPGNQERLCGRHVKWIRRYRPDWTVKEIDD